MKWNYRLMRYESGSLGIHEVYYDDEGDIQSWTQHPVPVVGDDLEEIKRTLNLMKNDIARHRTLEYPGEAEKDESVMLKP